jgi:hypothetical protein
MVTESNVTTQAYTMPLTLMNRRQEVFLFQSSLSLISILKKNIYSASIITLPSKHRALMNTEGDVKTAVENKI